MKTTLRVAIEMQLESMIERKNSLDKRINTFFNEGNLTDAAINQIKADELTLTINRIQQMLSNY